MNKKELAREVREESRRKLEMIKQLPSGKLLDYSYVSPHSVTLAPVKSFKEFTWQLARFEPAELYSYDLHHFGRTSMLALRYNWLDDYDVTFFIQGEEAWREALDKLGIECEVRHETRTYENTSLVCKG